MCQVKKTRPWRKSEKNDYRTHSRLQPVLWAPSLSESHERQCWVPSQTFPEAAACRFLFFHLALSLACRHFTHHQFHMLLFGEI